MKIVVRSVVALAALALVAAPAMAQQGSMVFLDSERLRAEAPGLQQARQQMQQEMGRIEAEADAALGPMQEELQRLIQEFQQQQAMMTPERRQQRQQDLAERQQRMQERGATFEQQAITKQNEILGPALERINRVIDQLREERGYAFILDVAAGGVIAADPRLDVTEEVLRRLRAQANQGS
jgi:outer membrane protein